jgi:hypothetical protein
VATLQHSSVVLCKAPTFCWLKDQEVRRVSYIIVVASNSNVIGPYFLFDPISDG